MASTGGATSGEKLLDLADNETDYTWDTDSNRRWTVTSDYFSQSNKKPKGVITLNGNSKRIYKWFLEYGEVSY